MIFIKIPIKLWCVETLDFSNLAKMKHFMIYYFKAFSF